MSQVLTMPLSITNTTPPSSNVELATTGWFTVEVTNSGTSSATGTLALTAVNSSLSDSVSVELAAESTQTYNLGPAVETAGTLEFSLTLDGTENSTHTVTFGSVPSITTTITSPPPGQVVPLEGFSVGVEFQNTGTARFEDELTVGWGSDDPPQDVLLSIAAGATESYQFTFEAPSAPYLNPVSISSVNTSQVSTQTSSVEVVPSEITSSGAAAKALPGNSVDVDIPLSSSLSSSVSGTLTAGEDVTFSNNSITVASGDSTVAVTAAIGSGFSAGETRDVKLYLEGSPIGLLTVTAEGTLSAADLDIQFSSPPPSEVSVGDPFSVGYTVTNSADASPLQAPLGITFNGRTVAEETVSVPGSSAVNKSQEITRQSTGESGVTVALEGYNVSASTPPITITSSSEPASSLPALARSRVVPGLIDAGDSLSNLRVTEANIRLVQGDTEVLIMPVVNKAGGWLSSSPPIDNIEFTMTTGFGDTHILTEGDITIVDTPDSRFRDELRSRDETLAEQYRYVPDDALTPQADTYAPALVIPSEQTAALDPTATDDAFVYQVSATHEGQRVTVLQGQVRIAPSTSTP